MLTQNDFWGNKGGERWTIFHDESICNEENILYHGFLFVRNECGKAILSKLIETQKQFCECYKKIHFVELSGLGSNRSKTAISWLYESISWFSKDKIRFYIFGVNKKNLNYNIWNYAGSLGDREEIIYRRFFEIGLKASIRWFKINEQCISHVYYDQGKQDIDRYIKAIQICGSNTIVKPLLNECNNSCSNIESCYCKILQLTDLLLGAVRRTYVKIGKSRKAQYKCIEILYDTTKHFSSEKTCYDYTNSLYKKFCISYFPKKININPEEFFNRNLEYYYKTRKLFYSERITYKDKIGKDKQPSML